MKSIFSTATFLLVLYSISSLRLNKMSLINQTKTNKAIHRILERIYSLNDDTSCKVASKFMLLTLGNIKHKREMDKYLPTGELTKDLSVIRQLLIDGNLLHIEIHANHHFIVFLKNEKQIYLLHAFQDRWKLIDWISNKEVIDTYLTLDDFIHNMSIILNKKSNKSKKNKSILTLFFPPFFNANPFDIQNLLKYFSGKIILINVNYVPFDFSIKLKGEKFENLNEKVISSYFISDKNKMKKQSS